MRNGRPTEPECRCRHWHQPSSGPCGGHQASDTPWEKPVGAISEVAIRKVGSSWMVCHDESGPPDHLFGLVRRPGEMQRFTYRRRHRRECENELPAHVVQVRVTKAVFEHHLGARPTRRNGFERGCNCTRGQVGNDAEPGEKGRLHSVESNGIKSAGQRFRLEVDRGEKVIGTCR